MWIKYKLNMNTVKLISIIKHLVLEKKITNNFNDILIRKSPKSLIRSKTKYIPPHILLRDNIVADSRSIKGQLHSDQLSIQRTVHKIYIYEHLTLHNKLLRFVQFVRRRRRIPTNTST